MSGKIEIECPTCRTEIVVDDGTGAIVWSKAPERPARGDLDSMIREIDESRESRDSVFEKSMSMQKDRERILEARFREAMERAKDDDEKPFNPLDYE